MQYSCFDPDAEIGFSRGLLPHWEQAGCYHFITFHAVDSLPAAARSARRDERNRWLLARGIDPGGRDWRLRLAGLPLADRRSFAWRFSAALEKLLDQGHGPCHLRHARLRSIVAETLMWFDGKRYAMEAFVVMPNHVHVLVGLQEPGALSRQTMAWKRYSAKRINAVLGRRGSFWQTESWDRLVRSPESFERIRRYIAVNPFNARLEPHEYTLWIRADGSAAATE